MLCGDIMVNLRWTPLSTPLPAAITDAAINKIRTIINSSKPFVGPDSRSQIRFLLSIKGYRYSRSLEAKIISLESTNKRIHPSS